MTYKNHDPFTEDCHCCGESQRSWITYSFEQAAVHFLIQAPVNRLTR